MTVKDLLELVGGEGADGVAGEMRRVAGYSDAGADAVVFAVDEAALAAAVASHAGVILAPKKLASEDARVVRVRDAKYAFALCGRAFAAKPAGPAIHASASIDASASVGEGTRVGAGAVVEADVVVGRDCVIGSNVTLCAGAQLGDRVVVQAGAVIGALGFGYVRNPETKEYLLFPQQGACVIEDDVEIGANTTIDRGALGETRIGRGSKIDNQVHIGHNCIIGQRVAISAQVGISGSCVIEDDAILAGQVGLGDHVRIGKGVILGGSAGVFPHKQMEGAGEAFMGIPAVPLKEYLKTVAKVRRLK